VHRFGIRSSATQATQATQAVRFRNMSTRLPIYLSLLIFSASVPASAPVTAAPDAVAYLRAAKEQFEAGRAGSRIAAEQAQQLFARLLGTDADNPLYLAYYGSTLAMQARDTRIPWQRIKLINQGLATIDRALTALDRPGLGTGPERSELETRLVAMGTFIALPDLLFHRLAPAKHQLGLALASPYFAAAPPDLQGHLVYEGALIARQEKDARAEREALLRVQRLAPPSVDLAEVRARLAELH
jgi:hypothetical protein